jgi:hypothetical protein
MEERGIIRRAQAGDPPPVAPLWARLDERGERPERRNGLLVRAFAFPLPCMESLSLRQSTALGLLVIVIVGAGTYGASVVLHPLWQLPAAEGQMHTRVH